MLRGHATAKIDAKGRVKVPSDFHDEFVALCGDQRRIYVTSLDGQSALVYPLDVWEEHERLLAERSAFDPAVQNYLRVTSFWGRETTVDRQGRFLLHPLLREAAGLDGAVSVFGKQRMLELSDFERLRAERPSVSREELQALARYQIGG
jgi:MraZ protein